MTFDLPHNQWGPIYATLQKESAKYTTEELEQHLAKIEATDPLRALWLSSIIGSRRRKEQWKSASKVERAKWHLDEQQSHRQNELAKGK